MRRISKLARIGAAERGAHLDAADAEFDERAQHFPACDLVGRTADGDLDEERVVVRRDLRAGETRAGIETDTVAASRAVDLNLTGIGLEVLCWVLSRDTALDGETALGDCLLCKAKLGKRGASCDLNLGGDDVDAGDLL